VGRRRIPRLALVLTLPLLAFVLGGCTILGWSPPGGTRGDVTREAAVLRAIFVAEEHVTPPLYDVLSSCGGDGPCDETGALLDAVDQETAALQAALDANPDYCLAESARTELAAYAELRKTETARGDAFFDATNRYDELKYRSFVASLDCPFLHGDGDPVDRAIRRASAAAWQAVRDVLACQPDGCWQTGGRQLARDARAAAEAAALRVADVEPGCEKDYLTGTLSMLRGYAEVGDLFGEGSFDDAMRRSVDLDAEDNRVMRAFVECLDTTSSGGGWAPAPDSSANA
jgi:hypothetical protein